MDPRLRRVRRVHNCATVFAAQAQLSSADAPTDAAVTRAPYSRPMESCYGRLRGDPDHLWLIAGSMRRVRVVLVQPDGTEVAPEALVLECDDGVLENLEEVSIDGQRGFAVSATKRAETWVRVTAGQDQLLLPVTVLASATHKLEKTAGDGQSGTVGRNWPIPLTILATDRYGNPVTGQRIVFSDLDEAGGAAEVQFAAETDGAGLALWAPLVRRAGPGRIDAHVAHRRTDDLGPSVSFDGLVGRDAKTSAEA